MAAFCWECTRDVMHADPLRNDFALPFWWPFPRTRDVLCEGCGLIAVDTSGHHIPDETLDKHRYEPLDADSPRQHNTNT